MAKAKKTDSNFITNSLKKELKTIVNDIVNSNKKLTVNDIETITIKKTDNGYILEANDGTNEDLPSVRVLETGDEDVPEEDSFKLGITDLLYNVATWAGYEYDEKSSENLNIDWNVVGENLSDEDLNEPQEDTETFTPPTKEEVIAAALGKAVEKIDAEVDRQEQQEQQDFENSIVSEEDLNDNEWVAGDDYGIPDDDLDDNHDDDEGYNEPFDDDYDDSDYEDLEDEN